MKIIKKVINKIITFFFGENVSSWVGERWYDFGSYIESLVNPICRANRERTAVFKNKHKGERCFIIGNGPSLNKTDLSLLKNEVTFGLNRIYLLFDELSFHTTYYVSINSYVVKQCAADMSSIKGIRFFPWKFSGYLNENENNYYFRTRGGPKFCKDFTRQGLWEGATVTYAAMQIAYYMGFSEVILVGVDHHFKTKGEPNKLVESSGDDSNHFSPEYFGKGFLWQLPDLETSELAYSLAREAYEKAGRKILDATVDGKLTIFDKVNFASLMKSR